MSPAIGFTFSINDWKLQHQDQLHPLGLVLVNTVMIKYNDHHHWVWRCVGSIRGRYSVGNPRDCIHSPASLAGGTPPFHHGIFQLFWSSGCLLLWAWHRSRISSIQASSPCHHTAPLPSMILYWRHQCYCQSDLKEARAHLLVSTEPHIWTGLSTWCPQGTRDQDVTFNENWCRCGSNDREVTHRKSS